MDQQKIICKECAEREGLFIVGNELMFEQLCDICHFRMAEVIVKVSYEPEETVGERFDRLFGTA